MPVLAPADKDVCPGYYPLVRPTFAASQVFVYHAEAITDFRGYATRKFFADILEDLNIAPAVFKKTWDDITGVQLTATLTDLTPANRLGIFTATVPIRCVLREDRPALAPRRKGSRTGLCASTSCPPAVMSVS